MDIQELNAVIADFVQVGYMTAIRAYEPPQDIIRQADLKKWLKMMKVDLKKFNALVSKEIIKPIRIGTNKNSPLYYSKTEIKQALSAANVSRLIANDIIKQTIKNSQL